MNQLSSTSQSRPVFGAGLMLVAALAFAASNIPQSLLPTPVQYGGFGMASTGMAFWQYLIATVFVLPLIFRIGLKNLRTRHPVLHEIRALVSALGIHVFVYGFAAGAPIWQMVTLLSTGPLFVILGSTLFLGEKASTHRLGAALVGFIGAILVSGVGGEGFTWLTLVPIAAAALWATTDVLTKYLLREESPETLTVSLLVLITPNHLLILFAATLWAWALPHAVPAGIATGFPFALPSGEGLWVLLALGMLTAAAQYLASMAYRVADATYLQPFTDLKLPLSAILGWVLLGQVPAIWFWPGAALILVASVFILDRETRLQKAARAADQTVITAA
jgi:drug/metabolite transporter (DMT)-like permease